MKQFRRYLYSFWRNSRTWQTRTDTACRHIPRLCIASRGKKYKKHCKTTRRCSGQYVYVGFSRRKIPRTSAYTIAEKAIRFRHPDYNPDRAQKLISLSVCLSAHLLWNCWMDMADIFDRDRASVPVKNFDWWRNYDNMLSRFARIPERDGQTDRQT